MPPSSTVWQYYNNYQWTDSDGRVRRTSTCNFCNKTYRSNATKMALHLVKQCRLCPQNIKLELGRYVEDSPQEVTDVALVIPQPVDSNGDQPSVSSSVTSQPLIPIAPKPFGTRKSLTPTTRPHSRWFKDTKAVWKHFVTETNTDDQGVTRSTSYCKYCNLKYTFPNVTKMRKHLLLKCRQCPQEVIEEVGGKRISEVGSAASASETSDQVVSDVTEEWSPPTMVQLDRWNPPSMVTMPISSSLSIQLSKPPLSHPGPSTSTGSHDLTPAHETRTETVANVETPSSSQGQPPMKRPCVELPQPQQQPIKKTHPLKMPPRENKKVDEAIARAVYSSDTPLNFAENYYWKEAFKILRITYTPPTKKMLTGKLLDEEYDRVHCKVLDKLSSATSVAIICDGWANQSDQNRINYTVSTPQPVFLKSTPKVECSVVDIASNIGEAIEEVGSSKVLLVLTDDSSENMREAWKFISTQFSHITTGASVGFTLRSLFSSIQQIESVKTICTKAKDFIQSIKEEECLYDTLKTRQEDKQQKMLVLPNKACETSDVLMIESLLACKDSLSEIMTQEELKVSIDIFTKVLDDNDFWQPFQSCLAILQPITSALTKLTSPKSLLSDIPQEFSKIISNLTEHLENSTFSHTEKASLHKLVEEKKSYCCFPVHYAANLLDPRYRGQTLTEDESAGAMDFIIRHSLHLHLDAGKVMANVAEFQAQEGRLWSMPSIWAAADHTDPSTWWKGMCGHQKIMPIASSLLSILPTSSVSMKKKCMSSESLDSIQGGQLNDTVKQKIIAIRANLHLLREGYHSDDEGNHDDDVDSAKPQYWATKEGHLMGLKVNSEDSS